LKLKVEQPTLWPQSTRVWLEGVEISHGLQSLTVQWSMSEITMATLTIGIREVDMDAQTIAHLIALAEQKQEASAK
jgi:hypothetical protein